MAIVDRIPSIASARYAVIFILAPAALLSLACSPQRRVRELLSAKTGVVRLPAGTIALDSGIALPDGAHDLTITGNSTTLRASNSFHGAAILSCHNCRRITVRGLSIDGNRSRLERPVGLPPSDRTFASFYSNNGLLFTDSGEITIANVVFREIPSFAILASNAHGVNIDHVGIFNSGSNSSKGHNNTTGGILLEEGTTDFDIRRCVLHSIRGNGIWTHSRQVRNADGAIAGNTVREVGRDAIQVGHAIRVQVVGNHGRRIGYPVSEIDVESQATPVGIDTAGNVDASIYQGNRFDEVNGKCIDLDGFHDGTVSYNVCSNRGQAEDYPWGQFGIVMNNSNSGMESRKIAIEGNSILGAKFGGIFVIGSGNIVRGNNLDRIDLAHCPDHAARFGCSYPAQPGVLESGIYLGSRGERPAPARGNIVEKNIIRGWRMKTQCIGFAPGVRAADNTIRENECSDE